MELSDIRRHTVAQMTKEYRQEVGGAANAVTMFAEEIEKALAPVYAAAAKGDWAAVLLAIGQAEQARERLDHAMKGLRNDAVTAVAYEKQHGG